MECHRRNRYLIPIGRDITSTNQIAKPLVAGSWKEQRSLDALSNAASGVIDEVVEAQGHKGVEIQKRQGKVTQGANRKEVKLPREVDVASEESISGSKGKVKIDGLFLGVHYSEVDGGTTTSSLLEEIIQTDLIAEDGSVEKMKQFGAGNTRHGEGWNPYSEKGFSLEMGSFTSTITNLDGEIKDLEQSCISTECGEKVLTCDGCPLENRRGGLASSNKEESDMGLEGLFGSNEESLGNICAGPMVLSSINAQRESDNEMERRTQALTESGEQLTGGLENVRGYDTMDVVTESVPSVVPVSIFSILSDEDLLNLNKVLGISLPSGASCQIYREMERDRAC